MCGIAGILSARPDEALAGHAATMGALLAHRGPDDHGLLLWDGRPRRGREVGGEAGDRLALVHRRLSILDLSAAGWQPMADPSGRFDIVYNGEIYNHVELRAELERLGHRFRSTSDTEVLLAAWVAWGEESLTRLTGMFAFALVDWRTRTLTLVRDPFGIKPLHWAAWPGGLAFASEARALLALPQVDRRVDAAALHDFLADGVTDAGEATLLAAVRQLPPGGLMTLSLDDPRPQPVRRWWRLPTQRQPIPFNEAAERLRALFLESVRLHLRADVPVGTCLSGGIDSSAIVMAMHRLGADIHAFTFAAEDAALDETGWASAIVALTGARHTIVRIDPRELAADLDALVAAQDFPCGSSSIYAQWRVFRAAAAAGLKVMLDGQGADEMFAGYRPFAAAAAAGLVRRGRVGQGLALARAAATLPGESLRSLLPRLAAGLAPRRLAEALVRRARPRRPWLAHRWFADHGVGRGGLATRGRAGLDPALRLSFETTSLPALLRYEDRNAMSHGIESRVPFLTPDLVALAFTLPEDHLIGPDGTGKAVLRRALRGLVPDPILDRRDKIGFQTPERAWLDALGPWVEGVLGGAADAVPALDARALGAEWRAVRAGRRRFDWRIWRCLNLVRWAERTGARFD